MESCSVLVRPLTLSQVILYIPDTLQMHGANLDHVTNFFALENAISTTTGHASNVQQLGTVDHMVICRHMVSLSGSFRTSSSWEISHLHVEPRKSP